MLTSRKWKMHLLWAAALGGSFLFLPAVVQGTCAEQEERSLATSYFPSWEFADFPYGIELVHQFEKDLLSLDEPSVFHRKNNEFAFRATWFSSFEGIAVLRIEKDRDGAAHIIYKRRLPTETLAPGKLTVRTGLLTRPEVSQIEGAVKKIDFFQLSNRQEVISTDGVYLLVEVNDGKKYHAVSRILPFDASIRALTRLALQLSKVDVDLDHR